MITRRHAFLAYLVFLVGFAAFKYLAAVPETFSVGYAVSVVILVLLTGVAPYFLARLIAARAKSTAAKWGFALIVSLIACCAGYAAFWALIIRPSGTDVPMLAVAVRGIYAGTIEGILAGLFVTAKDR